MEYNIQSLKKYAHKVGTNHWHIVFATKYRYSMFRKLKQHNLIEVCLRNVACKHNIQIHLMSVMPDHVHMLVTFPHTLTDSKAMMLLKGGSAHLFFKNHEKSKLRLPRGHLWSAGGCATTVGHSELNTIWKYIENQYEHHA